MKITAKSLARVAPCFCASILINASVGLTYFFDSIHSSTYKTQQGKASEYAAAMMPVDNIELSEKTPEEPFFLITESIEVRIDPLPENLPMPAPLQIDKTERFSIPEKFEPALSLPRHQFKLPEELTKLLSQDARDKMNAEASEQAQSNTVLHDHINKPPRYPAMARRLGYEGTVILKVVVLANGSPEKVEIIVSSGHAILDDAAKEAVKKWRFNPAKVGKMSVKSTIEIPVKFELK